MAGPNGNPPEFTELRLDQLVIGDANARRRDITANLDDLVNSIRLHDLQQPIVVRPLPGDSKFEIIIGQRRYLAFKQLGRETIPAKIVRREMDDVQARAISFSENVVRQDLDPKDKSEVCAYLLNRLGSVKEVARYLGVSEPTVRKWLDYADVPESIKAMVTQKRITRGLATRIWVATQDEPKAREIAEYVAQRNPPKEAKERILTAAQELPGRSFDAILQRAERLAEREIITFVLDDHHSFIIRDASRRMDKEPSDISREVTIDWLDRYGMNPDK
ncbi:MAG: ParB/RepB/Spo0J family partition protein [SAR202 cluster bacterium]|nr:ParB/RepB/Spo0J family partition protein [SAR202 cluster bacterium]